MVSQEKAFDIICQISQGFIPVEELAFFQVKALEKITYHLCDCPQCSFTTLYQLQDEHFESHVNVDQSRIFLSRQVFKIYTGIEESNPISNPLLISVLIQVILRSVLQILYPACRDPQLTDKALNWLCEFNWLDLN